MLKQRNSSKTSSKFKASLNENLNLDIISKKIKEIIVGKRPAGISLDEKNKKVYVLHKLTLKLDLLNKIQ